MNDYSHINNFDIELSARAFDRVFHNSFIKRMIRALFPYFTSIFFFWFCLIFIAIQNLHPGYGLLAIVFFYSFDFVWHRKRFWVLEHHDIFLTALFDSHNVSTISNSQLALNLLHLAGCFAFLIYASIDYSYYILSVYLLLFVLFCGFELYFQYRQIPLMRSHSENLHEFRNPYEPEKVKASENKSKNDYLVKMNGFVVGSFHRLADPGKYISHTIFFYTFTFVLTFLVLLLIESGVSMFFGFFMMMVLGYGGTRNILFPFFLNSYATNYLEEFSKKQQEGGVKL